MSSTVTSQAGLNGHQLLLGIITSNLPNSWRMGFDHLQEVLPELSLSRRHYSPNSLTRTQAAGALGLGSAQLYVLMVLPTLRGGPTASREC